jgi:hypothetical protein
LPFWISLGHSCEHGDTPHPARRLRARRERPRRRSADNTEKFPPPHADAQAQDRASYRSK